MRTGWKFLLAAAMWAAGIFVLMLPMALMDSDPPLATQYVRWLARAIGLAAFPAGVTVAADVFARPRAWRDLVGAIAGAVAVALLVFVLTALVSPLVSASERTLPQLVQAMNTGSGSWEARNDAAWDFYSTLFAPVNALLFAAIGVQVGIWATHALPVILRRVLYWIVGIGLLMSGYAVWDTTYEAIVLHTGRDVSFAAFYTLLVPLSICAGLALPTLALLRRAEIPGIDQ